MRYVRRILLIIWTLVTKCCRFYQRPWGHASGPPSVTYVGKQPLPTNQPPCICICIWNRNTNKNTNTVSLMWINNLYPPTMAPPPAIKKTCTVCAFHFCTCVKNSLVWEKIPDNVLERKKSNFFRSFLDLIHFLDLSQFPYTFFTWGQHSKWNFQRL